MEGTNSRSEGVGMENPVFEMTEKNDVHPPDSTRHRKIHSHDSNAEPNGELPHPNRKPKQNGNIVSKVLVGARTGVSDLLEKNKNLAKRLFQVGLFAGYNAYVLAAIAYSVRHDKPWAWCDGVGFLIIMTAILYWSLFYYMVLKGIFGQAIYNSFLKPAISNLKRLFSNKFVSWGFGILVLAGLVTFIVVDTRDEPKRLVSACGALVLLLIMFLLSKHPGEVQWRQVGAGLALQFIFALCVLRWEGGRNVLECISGKVTTFLSFADVGSAFVFNFAASGVLEVSNSTLPESLNLSSFTFLIPTTFAFTSLSVIFFFSFVVQFLYHIGAMLWVVRKVGWLLQIIVGSSAAESMNAAGNIFLGQTEAPLLIKPFMDDLTKSELHAIMTGGFATIAGSVMAAYISFGVKAESLLSASVMAAPCALALSKLMYPEVEESRTTHKQLKSMDTKTEGNAIDAAAKGASEGVALVWNIIANILAFVAFVALANAVLSWFGVLVGLDQLSFEWLLSKIFIPVALCLGVDPDESEKVAELLGLKIVVNEFVAYQKLQDMYGKKEISERSRRLAEYALCGFANLSSMGIQLGGLGAIAPKRRPDLAKVVTRAVITGATASLLNACIAGTLMSFDEPTN